MAATTSKTKAASSGNAYSGSWSQNLCPASKYSLKCPNAMKPVGICMHNTANSAPAKNEINYMNNNGSSTSFHLAVDENEAIQGLPFDRNGWHAGDGNGPGNRKHIGIEIARSTDNTPGVFERAERRAAAVVARLCNMYGWGVDQVKAHRDFAAKDCPHRTSMAGFKNMVALALQGKLTDSTSTKQTQTSNGASSVKVGDKVKITGTNYATGQTVPGWVKQNTYTVTKVSGDRALLSDIISWVYMSDLAVQGGSAPKAEAPKTEKPKTEASKTDSSKQTDAQKAQYAAALSELEKYPGGKLDPSKFLSMFGPIAREENRISGIPASVTLAQAALETGWGKSTIGAAKNLFGIKGTGPAGTTSHQTQEWQNGGFITIQAGFRKYNTWLESIQDHTAFLQKTRYQNAFKYTDNPDQFAREIHKAGYATDPEYSNKLIRLMNQYNMRQYNVVGATPATQSNTNANANANANKSPASSSSSGGVSVGSRVKIIGTNYATGQTVPGWVKQNTYSVKQVSGNRALLGGINSWVYIKDLAVEGASQPAPAPAPAKPSTASKSPLDQLLDSHPEVKTNQHLINLFYQMGGNTFDGAAAQASRYGVNINALVANRSGAVARSNSGGGGGSSSSSGSSAASQSIGVGSRVRITGSNYATGQAIPGWVKQNTYTVQQISGNRALISEIVSWVYIKDLQLISGGVTNSGGGGGNTSAGSSTSSKSVGVGSRVRITGSNYATGQSVPAWVKQNTYTVQQISGNRALISGILSWVYIKDLQLVSGGVSNSGGGGGGGGGGSSMGKTQSSGKATAHVDFGAKNSNPRNNSIRKITIHHMAGNLGAVSCAQMHRNGSCSANYYIGSDGTICSGVAENRRAWTSSSPANDHQAITYEVANNSGAPNWSISKAAYDAMIALSRDICSRYGINAYYDGSSSASLTTHDMFAATCCPGPYIKGKLKNGEIARDIKGG